MADMTHIGTTAWGAGASDCGMGTCRCWGRGSSWLYTGIAPMPGPLVAAGSSGTGPVVEQAGLSAAAVLGEPYKGLLFPVQRAGPGSCPPGQAVQGAGSLSFGRGSGFSKEKQVVFPPGPTGRSRESSVLWCHSHGVSSGCRFGVSPAAQAGGTCQRCQTRCWALAHAKPGAVIETCGSLNQHWLQGVSQQLITSFQPWGKSLRPPSRGGG